MAGRLEGRIALITGASRGIGAATAWTFAREGARIAAVSRKQEGLDALAAEIEAEHPGSVVPIAAHVGHVEDIDELFDEVEQRLGLPDILVNNAGTNPHFGPLLTVEWGAWDKTFEVNLKGPFALTRALAQRQFRGRLPVRASVVNVASVLGAGAAKLQGVYGMTKAALVSMTRTFAHELGGTGLRVNAIAPGIVDTRLAGALTGSSEFMEIVQARTALGRVARPEEIAPLIAFLASDDASFITGETVFIDGGWASA